MDLTRRVLLVDGEPVALHARAFDILEYLVTCRGRAVTRDEIVRHVWRGVVVGENNLTVQIWTLRRVLAQHGGEDLIVTVPHRGYQFVDHAVPKARLLAAPPPEPLSPPAGDRVGTRDVGVRLAARQRWLAPGLAAAALVLITATIGWQEVLPSHLASGSATGTPFSPPPYSVAVLAFSNMSGDPKQEYLSDGISDELIDTLSRLRQLRVVARTSSFYFKAKAETIDEIARRLNVGAVLEGSVRREGTRFRITAHLTDAISGYALWSNSFDRDQGDIFAIEASIAQSVAAALKVALKADDVPKLGPSGTANPKAFDAYLRGHGFYTHKPGGTGDQQAIAAFDEAIALDPTFANARVSRAMVLEDEVDYGFVPDVATAMRKLDDAFAECNRALAIEPGNAWAYAGRASIALDRSFDFSGAATDFAHARALLPDTPWIEIQYASFQLAIGRSAASIATSERALSFDPMNVGTHLMLAWSYYFARRFADAREAMRHAVALGEAGLGRGRGLGGFISLMSNDFEGARRDCAAGTDAASAECSILALHALGKMREAEAALVGLRASAGDTAAYGYAEIYAQWGEQDKALYWLSRSFDLHDVGLLELKEDPLIDPIRETRGFKEIEQLMKFPA